MSNSLKWSSQPYPQISSSGPTCEHHICTPFALSKVQNPRCCISGHQVLVCRKLQREFRTCQDILQYVSATHACKQVVSAWPLAETVADVSLLCTWLQPPLRL